MKIKISDRDKRMLIVLVLFFAALGYYYLIFAPSQKMSSESAVTLRQKQDALSLAQTKLRQIRTWQSYKQRLLKKTGSIYNAIKAPSLNVNKQARIDAIMQAAKTAGVRIENLKPVASSKQLPDGSTQNVYKKFLLDGKGSFNQFLRLIRLLYGMKINQFSLAAHGDSKTELMFSIMVESLPQVKLDIKGIKKIKPRGTFEMNHSLFRDKKVQLEKKPVHLTPAEIKTEEEKAFAASLHGIDLQGIVWLDNTVFAVISDPENLKEAYKKYRKNDKIRDGIITEILDDSVMFSSVKNPTITYKLELRNNVPSSIPAAAKNQKKDFGAQPSIANAPRKPRLGLEVQPLTAPFIRKTGFKGDYGLIVLKSYPSKGIYRNDVIIGLNGHKTASLGDALTILNKLKSGERVSIRLIRNNQLRKRKLTLE